MNNPATPQHLRECGPATIGWRRTLDAPKAGASSNMKPESGDNADHHSSSDASCFGFLARAFWVHAIRPRNMPHHATKRRITTRLPSWVAQRTAAPDQLFL